MEIEVKQLFDNLASSDDKIRMAAFQEVMKITENKVNWIYDVWDDLVNRLNNPNSYQRSIAIMVLCNLAKSDWQNRMEGSLDGILAHTGDEKFITSRQCIQSVWKIALTNNSAKGVILDHLVKQFEECTAEKHYNLIRQDIIGSMRMISDHTGDEELHFKGQGINHKRRRKEVSQEI